MENRLKAKYESEIRPALIEKFNYSSIMQAPKIDKIVLKDVYKRQSYFSIC